MAVQVFEQSKWSWGCWARQRSTEFDFTREAESDDARQFQADGDVQR